MIVEGYDPVNKEEFECPICMDDVSPGSGYSFQSCGHTYCGEVGKYNCTNLSVWEDTIKH